VTAPLAVTLVAVLGALAPAAAAAPPLGRVPAVLHVHSTLSTGDFELDELARMAERDGIAALLLTENYLVRIEYGLPPFRALTRVVHEEPSVLNRGLDRYLARVAEAQQRHPRVVIVPGVEIIPHYFWSGSPLALALHNTQKNLLVFGVSDPAALATLPAVGNRRPPRYSWQSVVDALPAVLVVPGLALLIRKRCRRRRLGRAFVVIRQRSWCLGSVLIALGALALARAWPLTVDRFPPWRDYGMEPYQALIDRVERLGGATVWSFPEAPDSGERRIGPVRVTWSTDPYPDDLLRTFRYTAFGAVYEQATRVSAPGGTWDRLLRQYAAGERSRPAWAVGESGFHGLSAGKRLGAVQTVFLAPEASAAAVLDALKRGRLYALRRTPELALTLGEFTVNAAGGSAVSGETLAVGRGTPLEVRVRIETSDASAEPLKATLVKNGVVVEAWATTAPLRAVYRDVFDGTPLVFRVDVHGRMPHHLVTNPIFVRPS
jgi:hypothetical protein